MNRRAKWVVGVCLVSLMVSLFFNWSAERTIRGFAANAQGNFIEGWGLIRQADDNLDQGNKVNASVDVYKGIGYLQASSGGMSQIGVHGVLGIAMFIDHAMSSLLGYTIPGQTPDSESTKKHYQEVIQVFIDGVKPFGRVNFGSINNHQLQQTINQVYQAMTPQERQQFQGWGP